MNLRFDSGASHLMVGPPAAGKTYRTCNILKHRDIMIQGGENIKNVVLWYSVWQPLYQQLKNDGIVHTFINKKPSCEDFSSLMTPYKDKGGSICVIDDFMGNIDTDLVTIVTVLSRHLNTSTFILFQSLFPANRLARQISLNVKYIHIHKNPRENSQFQTLARQVAPKDYKWIVAAYQEVTKQPHGCLLLDMTQTCNDTLRYRSNYLPSEKPMRIWQSVKQ